ncbi:hypothetical protein RB653_001129 [Dictyostelium firmibasis]|uniref:alpha-1,2-Mannosidase n=1 Tax=Dictyostelium firmibasis TaxID=79012 RepID=A0AAN7YUZ4_9MYCE
MNLKRGLFSAIFILVAVFFIGITTILSFEGSNQNDVETIPIKWKNLGNEIHASTGNQHFENNDQQKQSNQNNGLQNQKNQKITSQPKPVERQKNDKEKKPVPRQSKKPNPNSNSNSINNKNKNNNNNSNNSNINNKNNFKKKSSQILNSGNPFNRIDNIYKENQKLNIKRSNEIRDAMKYAWEKYKQYAWGYDELQPITKDHKEWFGLGLSIVDSLDTLKIMNLEKEYKEGRDWVENELKQSKDTSLSVSVFETIIRVLGSHVTMYGLTKDEVYLEKAKEIGDLLLYAFPDDNNSPFPASSLVLATHEKSYPGWTGGCVILAEVGTIFLEFNELSKITGDPKYKEYSDKVVNAISKLPTQIPGLLPVFINREATDFCNNVISIGGLGDSYYEYLLKMWIYTNGGPDGDLYKRLFIESADSIIKHMYKVSPQGDGYITSLEYGSPTDRQEHLTCFAGGMFALAAVSNITGDDKKSLHYMEVGEMVTKTCAKAYMITSTGLAPESYHIDPKNGNIRWHGSSTLSWYLLRPETVESLFILYRLTGDAQYQEWSWKIFEAIQDVCKKENGYVGLKNVDDRNSLDNNQQSFFMAETLKYLYLTFQPSSVIPLDKYVFNTEAHPIPIKNK